MARAFDGIDDVVDAGDLAEFDNISALTVAYWFYYVTATTYDWHVSKVLASGADGWGILTSDPSNDLYILARNGDNTQSAVTTSGVLTTGTWHRIVYVFDGSLVGNSERLKLFVNGTQGTLTFNGGAVPATIGATTASVLVGGPPPGNNFPECRMAYVFVWIAALSIAEAEMALRTGRARRSELFYAMLSSASPEPDFSGNVRNGTVTGTTIVDNPPAVGPIFGFDVGWEGEFTPGGPTVPQFMPSMWHLAASGGIIGTLWR